MKGARMAFRQPMRMKRLCSLAETSLAQMHIAKRTLSSREDEIRFAIFLHEGSSNLAVRTKQEAQQAEAQIPFQRFCECRELSARWLSSVVQRRCVYT